MATTYTFKNANGDKITTQDAGTALNYRNNPNFTEVTASKKADTKTTDAKKD